MPLNRRHFLRTAAAAALPPIAGASRADDAFSFVLLGDLHFDRLEHHDMAWLDKNHGGDLGQIKNYSRITADLMPALFAAARKSAAASQAAFVLQVGDLVEGLCGTADLAARQNAEALAFVKRMNLGRPFLFTKGNHDVTGDGAPEAFREVFHPFLREQAAALKGVHDPAGACYTVGCGDALFCFFDAYDASSLDWLEAALAKRTARHCFVVIHPPVVPYGARATWHLYAAERDAAKRGKLLAMLGRQRVIVLGGHIHRFNAISRETPGGGRFAQLAISSVVNSANAKADTELSGVAAYNGDQITVEPRFSPETAEARRAVYAAEAPQVKAFEYADLPGHAIVSVTGDTVRATLHGGTTREVWKTIDLTKLLG
jgi:hypothetical protein